MSVSLIEKVSRTHQVVFGLLIAWVLAAAPSVHADKIDNLYEATIPVENQSRDTRNEATRIAFREVMIRVSGRMDIFESAEFPQIEEAMLRSTRYVQQYRFKRIKVPREDGRGHRYQLVLWVRFDEKAVNDVLSENLLPVWGKTRPATLVWLVIDNKGERELIGNNSTHPARVKLEQRSSRRGVPLRFPLLDLQDTSSLRVSDVWGNFEGTILKASARYKTEAVLVGRVYQTNTGYWMARWTLYQDSRRLEWTTNGVVLAEVLDPGIDKTVELLAQRYAAFEQQDDSERVLVHIKDIKSLNDYNRTVKYLTSLSNVRLVQTYRVAADSTYFYLVTSSGRTGVSQSVSLGHLLIPEQVTTNYTVGVNPDESGEGANKLVPDLVYRLVP